MKPSEALDKVGFMHNQLVQDAVIRNLEIIGEACSKISQQDPEFAATHPELPLLAAYPMRNALAHGYFKVDFEAVWNTIQRDLPKLESQIEFLRTDMQNGKKPNSWVLG